MLDRLRYGYLIIPSSTIWRVVGDSLIMASAMSYSLHGKAGVLQSKSASTRSATFSAAMQNISNAFFHTIGRVNSMVANFSSSNSKVKTSPSLGASVGRNPMC